MDFTSNTQSSILCDILNSNSIKGKFTSTSLAKEIDINVTNKNYIDVLKYLIEKNAIYHHETVGSCNILKANKKMIIKILTQTEYYLKIEDIMHNHGRLTITPF